MRYIMAATAWIKRGLQRVVDAVKDFNRRMRTRYDATHLALIATAVLALGLIIQLFLPPYLGVSNDGSVDAVLQDTGLARLDPGDTESYFSYYERVYRITPRTNAPDTTPWLLRLFVRAAVMLDTLLTRDALFDTRFLAALYALCYLAVAFLLLRALLSRVHVYAEGLVLAGVGVLIMGDTALVTRFASLYTQPLEWILFMGIVDALFAISARRGQGMGPAVLCGLVLLLMGVNRYMALAGLVFSLVFWRLLGLKTAHAARAVYILMALLLTGVSVMQVAEMTATQTRSQKYDQMTRGVLFQASNPETALAEFGIEPRYSLLTDTYAEQTYPVALMDSDVLETGFFDRYGTKEICIYYLRHPMSLLGLFDIGVQRSFASRPSFSGNFERSLGLPPMAKSPFPALWSTFKEQSAPKTVGSIFVLLMIFALIRHRNRDPKEDTIALSRELLDVVLVFAAAELLTVLVMTGDSELIRESFLMGTAIDLLVMIFLTEILHKTNIMGQEEN